MNMPSDGEVSLKVHMDGEDALAAAETITDAKFNRIELEKATVFTMDLEIEKHMRDCDNVPLITPCINSYFDKTYGTGYGNQFPKFHDRALTNFAGYTQVRNKTKCQLPCERTNFKLEEFTRFSMKRMMDPYVQEFWQSYNRSRIPGIIINHQKPEKVVQYEEVLEYDGNKFISDSGGIIGIFVGLSFWSLFDTFVAPIIQWVERRIQEKL